MENSQGVTKSPKKAKFFDFDNLVTALSIQLNVNTELLIEAFDNSAFKKKYSGQRELYFRRRKWRIEVEKDGSVAIISADKNMYKVSGSKVKQFDKTTQKMIERDIVVITFHPTIIGRQFSDIAYPPDSFEP